MIAKMEKSIKNGCKNTPGKSFCQNGLFFCAIIWSAPFGAHKSFLQTPKKYRNGY
jgi:hypothetical protein